MKDGICQTCGIKIPNASYSKKYCGRQCIPLWSKAAGSISELRTAVDLMKRGYEVFRAVDASASCDLLILKDQKTLRVQVKTSHRLANGRIFQEGLKGNFDVLALVLPDKVLYIPDL